MALELLFVYSFFDWLGCDPVLGNFISVSFVSVCVMRIQITHKGDIPVATAKEDKTIDNTAPDLQTLMKDLAALKGDFSELLSHFKATAGNAAHTTVEQLEEGATRFYKDIAARSERSVKAIGDQVEKQPIASLLIAFALGFICSRLFSR